MNEIIRRFMRQEDVGKFAANVAAAEKNVRESLLRVRQKGYYPPAGRYGEDLYAAAKECGETVLYESYARWAFRAGSARPCFCKIGPAVSGGKNRAGGAVRSGGL